MYPTILYTCDLLINYGRAKILDPRNSVVVYNLDVLKT